MSPEANNVPTLNYQGLKNVLPGHLEQVEFTAGQVNFIFTRPMVKNPGMSSVD